MAHVLAPKRNWVLLLPLCFHGLGLVFGAIVWLVYGVGHLADGTASARHLLRAPTAAERAGGRTWFTAPSEALTLARPIGGLVPRWEPTGDPVPLTGTDDPWGGCAVRRRVWVSGKHAAWRDAEAWSWGAYLLRDPRGGTVLVPLSSLTSARRSVMSPSELRAMLPNEPAASAAQQYVRECFPEHATVAVDGVVEGGLLVRGADGGTGARLESAEGTRARARRGLAFEVSGLFGIAGPLVWLGLLLAFVRQSFALRGALTSVQDARKGWRALLLGGLAGGGLGVLVGSAAISTGRVAPQIAVGTVVAGSFAGVWWALAQSAAVVVRTFRAALVAGGTPQANARETNATKAREGVVVAPEQPVIGAVTERTVAFVQVEAFTLTLKGAVGAKVIGVATPSRIEATDGEGRFFVETATAAGFGPAEELRLDGAGLQRRGIDGPFVLGQRYLLRETALAAGDPVTVFGASTSEADPLARGEDYRDVGRSAVFVGTGGKGPLVFGGRRSELLAQATSDLNVLAYLRGVAGLLAVLVVVVPAVAIVLGG